MPAPSTIEDFLEVVRKSNQVDPGRLEAYLEQHRKGDTLPPEPKKFAALLVREGLLTNFQAEQFLQGKYRGFNLGGYRILERLGSGGTGTVYLAEHEVMKRMVALKVLPPSVSSEQAILERFRREAQAAAALDHPNIVRAYDFRQEGQLHFLVMEYVNGPSLEQVLQSHGPLSVPVACEYIRQAALGLQHAHEAGLVHRDIKPGNLLVDPTGMVKILDMGLARFTPEGQESLTKKFDENTVMGTADYLAPEQALNLHHVDSRADIYSLGATLYALLAGEPPFASGTVTQKLLWHQMRDPTPLHERRSDVPEEVELIVATMMAKDIQQRYQSAAEVAEVLSAFCSTTPTPQGPARPGSGTGTRTSPYVRASSVGPSTSRKMAAPTTAKEASSKRLKRSMPAPVPEEPLEERQERRARYDREERSRDDWDDREERIGTRRERGRYDEDEDFRPLPDIRKKPAEAGNLLGVMLLGSVIGVVLLIVGAVVAFLIFGPSPTAVPTGSADPEDRPRPQPERIQVKQPAPPPAPLPEVIGEIHCFHGASAGIERVAFSPDGSKLAASSKDRLIRIWDVLNRNQIGQLGGHNGEVFSVSFDTTATRILSSSADGVARLWPVPHGTELKAFRAQTTGRLWCAVFNQNSSQVITAGEDKILRVWDVASGKKLREFKGHQDTINGLVLRGGNRPQVLSASWDKTLKLWDINSGKLLRTFEGHTDRCASVATSLDGQQAVSASYDGTMKLWEVETGTCLHTFEGHKGEVWIVAISRDGRRALSGGVDRIIRLWDLREKKLERTYEGHTNSVTGLAFLPNGKHFASGSLDHTVRLWGLPPLKP